VDIGRGYSKALQFGRMPRGDWESVRRRTTNVCRAVTLDSMIE